jgi:hypothetical protein
MSRHGHQVASRATKSRLAHQVASRATKSRLAQQVASRAPKSHHAQLSRILRTKSHHASELCPVTGTKSHQAHLSRIKRTKSHHASELCRNTRPRSHHAQLSRIFRAKSHHASELCRNARTKLHHAQLSRILCLKSHSAYNLSIITCTNVPSRATKWPCTQTSHLAHHSYLMRLDVSCTLSPSRKITSTSHSMPFRDLSCTDHRWCPSNLIVCNLITFVSPQVICCERVVFKILTSLQTTTIIQEASLFVFFVHVV